MGGAKSVGVPRRQFIQAGGCGSVIELQLKQHRAFFF